MLAASLMAALLAEPMCAGAWPWALVPLPSVRHAITTAPHADIIPIRLVTEFVCREIANAGGEAKWPRALSGFPLIHRQFRVSYFIQTQNSRLTQSDGVLGASPIPRHPTKRPVCLRTKDPSPQMLGPLLCDANARFRKLAFGTLIRIKAVGRRTCTYQNGVQHKRRNSIAG
jgi:hypothetical protein